MHRRAEREGKITITTYVKVHIYLSIFQNP